MQSDTVVPVEQDGNIYTFDLSGTATVVNGDFTDLEVEYVTYEPDSDMTWAYDFSHEVWTELEDLSRDEQIIPKTCFRLFSTRHLDPADFVDGSGNLLLRGDFITEPKVTVFEINPDYYWFNLTERAQGLAWGEGTLWISTWGKPVDSIPHRIKQLSYGGEVIDGFDLDPEIWRIGDIAFDGCYLWAYSFGSIFKVDRDGHVLCSFETFPFPQMQLSAGRENLWISGHNLDAREFQIAAVDPLRSCALHTAVGPDTLHYPIPMHGSVAYANGSLFLGADSLYKIATTGEILDVWPAPVEDIWLMAYGDGLLWIIGTGPEGTHPDQTRISAFRLR
jgi:hypothetical protein